jgi:hypothetical protein
MRFMRTLLSATALMVGFAGPIWADAPLLPPQPSDILRCQQPDGSVIYTNKDRDDCQKMLLRSLSVVPSLDHMPTAPRPVPAAAPRYDMAPYQDRTVDGGSKNIPDWARDWHASIAPTGSVQEEVCSLFSEWMHLVQKTRGGFFFGSDPSYGGDLTARNQRGPSNSFYDNARFRALSRIFGTGFIPVNCQ